MITLANKIGSTGVGEDSPISSEEVFSTYVYDGNGGLNQISNGLDLLNEGGAVWTKSRDITSSHLLTDTEIGPYGFLSPNTSSGVIPFQNQLSTFGFNSDGFSIDGALPYINGSSKEYVSWSFRKHPKFLDILTVTHTSGTDTVINTALTIDIGMVIIKYTSGTSNWGVAHAYLPGEDNLYLNASTASTSNTIVSFTGTTVTIKGTQSTGDYVIYAFANDTSEDSIIKCGVFTETGSNFDVDLGWEPQFLLTKSWTAVGNWWTVDNIRKWNTGKSDAYLFPNLTNAENTSPDYYDATATGFTVKPQAGSGVKHIYMAIKRPTKVPTSSEEVFAIDTRNSAGTGVTPAYSSPFVVDMTIERQINTAAHNSILDRGNSGYRLYTNLLNADAAYTSGQFYYNKGWNSLSSTPSTVFYSWMWGRAKGFFDMVHYLGDGTVSQTYPHNLKAVPEMIWIKNKGSYFYWAIYHKHTGATQGLKFDNQAAIVEDYWYDTEPTSSGFTVSGLTNATGGVKDYVAYLFATLPGVSKVGSYIGDGSTNIIDAGFTTGCKFLIIKRANSTGDWVMMDADRGLDNWVSLNTPQATQPNSGIASTVTGFEVTNNRTTNLNVLGAEYIYYAIANPI